MMKQDWVAWHSPYDEPGSRLARRLAAVQRLLGEALDHHGPEARVLSMCAGQGRDVVPVLALRSASRSALRSASRSASGSASRSASRSPSRGTSRGVQATLVELDAHNARTAAAAARRAGLTRVKVRCADAGSTDTYAGLPPADVVLACGIFGNITADDVRRTVRCLPMLCAPGATVLWTRGWSKEYDQTPLIRGWFADAGFAELAFEAPEDVRYSVGAHRLVALPRPLEPALTMFRFVR